MNFEKFKTFKEKIEKVVFNFYKHFKQENNNKIELKPSTEEKKQSNFNNDQLFGLKNIGNTCN